jgi:hypothetical protein
LINLELATQNFEVQRITRDAPKFEVLGSQF